MLYSLQTVVLVVCDSVVEGYAVEDFVVKQGSSSDSAYIVVLSAVVDLSVALVNSVQGCI